VTDMNEMFWDCDSLTDLKATDERIRDEYSKR